MTHILVMYDEVDKAYVITIKEGKKEWRQSMAEVTPERLKQVFQYALDKFREME